MRIELCREGRVEVTATVRTARSAGNEFFIVLTCSIGSSKTTKDVRLRRHKDVFPHQWSALDSTEAISDGLECVVAVHLSFESRSDAKWKKNLVKIDDTLRARVDLSRVIQQSRPLTDTNLIKETQPSPWQSLDYVSLMIIGMSSSFGDFAIDKARGKKIHEKRNELWPWIRTRELCCWGQT